MILETNAPARIDLAGGTLDIWPLHLLLEDPVTVNVAIDLYATCRIKSRRDTGVRIVSRDRKTAVAGASLKRLRSRKALNLVLEFVRHFSPSTGFTLETRCAAPAGSGLGGSSALAVALAACLGKFCRRRISRERLIRLCRDLEARVIRIPTGTQDYIAALHGGWNAIWYGPEGQRVERLAVETGALERRAVLIFTGRSRASARSNWDIIRRCLEGEATPLNALKGIGKAALRMRHALVAGAWEDVARAMRVEWRWRERLSPAVGLGGVREWIRKGLREGALAAKPCGAGGGGCVLFLCRERNRGRLQAALERAGARTIRFRVAKSGVGVKNLDGDRKPGV